MKPIKERANILSLAIRVRWALWLLLSVVLAPVVRAESVLLSDTTLVSGSQSTVFSFQAPGPGTLSVELTDIDWPQTLSSLSFMATSGSQVLASWSDPGSQSGASLSFQVTGGRYFADVLATAGGPLDLGLYSLAIQFKPAVSPVALPASGVLLLTGLVLMVAVRRVAHARRAALQT
jgi:hypothetical protein